MRPSGAINAQSGSICIKNNQREQNKGRVMAWDGLVWRTCRLVAAPNGWIVGHGASLSARHVGLVLAASENCAD